MATSGLSWLVSTVALNLPRRGPRTRSFRGRSRLGAIGLTVLLTGSLLVACCIAFAGAAVPFGVSIGLAAAAALTLPGSWRSDTQAAAVVLLLTFTLAIWTIVATAWTFAPGAARWIAFGSGVGFMALGVAALVLHELRTVRVVHVLEIRAQR